MADASYFCMNALPQPWVIQIFVQSFVLDVTSFFAILLLLQGNNNSQRCVSNMFQVSVAKANEMNWFW